MLPAMIVQTRGRDSRPYLPTGREQRMPPQADPTRPVCARPRLRSRPDTVCDLRDRRRPVTSRARR
jgi:hypothetical protein